MLLKPNITKHMKTTNILFQIRKKKKKKKINSKKKKQGKENFILKKLHFIHIEHHFPRLQDQHSNQHLDL